MKTVYTKRQTMIVVSCLIFLFCGILCLTLGTNNKKEISIKYKEDNDIDYKVYLKDNDFFDDKYLEKEDNKPYITSFIDYIHVDYKYSITFDQKVDGKYRYKVVAQIEANKTDNQQGNYWTKKYDITDEKTENIIKQTGYAVYQSINIDYNKYNEILSQFKKSAGLTSSDGVLKVYLEIKSEITGEKLNTPIDNNLILKLPLSQMAIEATIDSDVKNEENRIIKVIKDDNIIYLGLITLGLTFLVIGFYCIWIFFRNKRIYTRNHQYEVELKKITSTYDSIIVNVEKVPSIENYNVINVESFEELIDAHSEVRMPINYYQAEEESIFILFNDNTAWKYTLRKNRKRSARK